MKAHRTSSAAPILVATIATAIALLVTFLWPPAFWLSGVGAAALALVVSVASIGRRESVLWVFWVPKDDPPLARWHALVAMPAVILLVVPLVVVLMKNAAQ
jgi:hypothetical protein